MRLDSQCLTPRARRKAVHAGGTAASHSKAAASLQELAEWDLKPARVAELTQQTGREMKEQQTARVEAYHQQEAQRPLTAPREPAAAAPANAPQVGVVEMDGGRMRGREAGSPRGVKNPHWREFQAGCVVRLQSEASAEDPRPDVPRLFLDRPRVQKLVSQLHRQRGAAETAGETSSETAGDEAEESIGQMLAAEQLIENAGDAPAEAATTCPQPSTCQTTHPVRLLRTCVATLAGADACGRILAAEAHQRGLHEAPRKAFISDGQTALRSVWETYFKRSGYVPILDFIHLLSYVYAVAMAVGRTSDAGWQLHVRWITALWSGRAAEVLREWQSLADEQQIRAEPLPENDPRRPLQRGLTYLQNNLDRVDYPRYRRQGLPVTSTLMESLVKEFNQRVKGTEKFWNDPAGAESILTVRAALLSEDDRFKTFFATRPGHRFRRRSTLRRQQPSPSTPPTAA